MSAKLTDLYSGVKIIVMSCVWFCPESPRYLVAQGKREEALAVLVKHHTSDGKINALIEVSPNFQLSMACSVITCRFCYVARDERD